MDKTISDNKTSILSVSIVDETVLLSVIIYSFNKYFKSIEWENSN